MKSTQPTFLIGANRPNTGRTLFALMLADWLSSVDAMPCALVEADPLRGSLSRLSGCAAANVSGTGPLPANGVVDNADNLATKDLLAEPGDRRTVAAMGRWTAERAKSGDGGKRVLCAIIDDNSDADRASLEELRSNLPAHSFWGLVAIRNTGMSMRFPTQADQRYAAAGGWPTSGERKAWLDSGAREMVLAKPAASLLRQARVLGADLAPTLGRHSGLWLLSRQQFLRWRRDFADRARRAFQPLRPGTMPASSF